MKKTIIYIIFGMLFTLSVFAQPPVTSELGTINSDYNFYIQRTSANTEMFYCIGFTLNKEATININNNNANLTFVGHYKMPSTTAITTVKFNQLSTLVAGEYRFYFVNSSKVAFRLDMTFTFPTTVTIPNTTLPEMPLNIVPTGQNYIRTTTPIIEKSAVSYNTDEEMVSYQYFDGLGRPTETVQRAITSLKSDLVNIQEYDEFGREANSWLPVAIASNSGTFADLTKVKTAITAVYPNETAPYSKPVYEYSPLNRIQQEYGPGAAWHNNSKAVKIEYLSNTSAHVCGKFTTTDDKVTVSLTRSGSHTVNELYVTKITNEDGYISYEFKNKSGQVILTRQMDGTTAFDTYFVYDNFGNLRAVLPPEAGDKFTSGTWEETTQNLKDLAYLYKYDGRNRCIAKKLPGAEWVYFVYDKADRLIFSQDGEQRKSSQWMFSIPDIHGRPAITGVCSNAIIYTANPLANAVVKADWAAASNTTKGYTVTGVTLASPVVYTANYYDSYAFMSFNGVPGATDADFKYEPVNGYGTQYATSYKGLLTGTLVAQLSTSATLTHLNTVMYYDYRGRLIQTKASNHLTGGVEKEYIAYNFAGQPVRKQHVHIATGKTTQTEIYTNTYDHGGRLTQTTHQLNGGTVVTLADDTYDELGRLKTSIPDNQANLKTTYAYNVRSWTEQITSTNFWEKLTYSYSGNINTQEWNQAAKTRKYTFAYDNLSRLKTATYANTAATDEKFGVSYTYDKHGNIKTLARNGLTATSTYGVIDNLTMYYSGNQMIAVTDAVANIALAVSADFKEYTKATTGEYTYNANGAMTQDKNKGITSITNNALNLPLITDIKSPVAEARNEYTYTATGQKIKVVQKWNPSFSTAPVIGSAINTTLLTQSKTTDYAGNKIYENGVLKKILTDNGYYESGIYYFYIKDHLGNNRIVSNQTSDVVQSTQYYPFGMAFADATSSTIQPYKYSGKELDVMHGLNQYDVEARYYDPGYIRFTSIDPLAEKYYSWSPYMYVGNNPLKYIDLDGKQWGIPPALLGTNNPIAPLGRTATMLSSSDKIVRVVPRINEHHAMSQQFKGNPVIEAAREVGFKFEGKENKIQLEQFSKATGKGTHGNHPKYNEQISKILDGFSEKNPNYSPEQALKFVREQVQNIKNIIENNSTTKINDLKLNGLNNSINISQPSDNTKVNVIRVDSPTDNHPIQPWKYDDNKSIMQNYLTNPVYL